MGRTKYGDQRCWEKGNNVDGSNGSAADENKSAANNIEIDEEQGQIQDVIGHFGKYQFLIFMFKILIGVTSAFNNLSVTFFAPSDFVSFWCVDQSVAGLSLSTTTTTTTLAPFLMQNSSHLVKNLPIQHQRGENLIAQTINNALVSSNLATTSATEYYQNIFSEFLFSEERKFRHDQMNFRSSDTPRNIRKECYFQSPADGKNYRCSSYQYDTGIWISTIIDEWSLVCDRAWFISVTQSLYMSGFIVSFLVFGYISDRFGRWRSLLFGGLIEIVSGFGCAFAGSVTSFMIFRFLLGLGNAGRSSSSYLIMIEWAGPKWRMHISTMGSLGWVIGYCSMPWITLYFLHFRHMQLFVCVYESIFIIWLLCLPESPRWLLTHKKFNEAYEVLLMAAKFNGLIKKDCGELAQPASQVTLTTAALEELDSESYNTDGKFDNGELLKPYTIEQYNIKFKRLVNTIYAKKFTSNEDNLSIIDLFKWRNLRRYAFILFFVWAANSFIYYGIALRVGDFGGRNLFVAFTIAGITELPSLAFTILCMKFLPRKTTNLFLYTTVGLLCILQVPLKYYEFDWLQQGTAMLAKLFNSCSFTVILYQTMELFPTSIRQTAYSSCSLAGRIGSILAPFVKELSQITNDSVPPVMYAILSLVTAILVTGLPETKGTDLPDTLLEAETKKQPPQISEHTANGKSLTTKTGRN